MIIEGIILAILEDCEEKLNKIKEKTKIQKILNKELSLNKFNMAAVTAIANFKNGLVEWLNNWKNTSIAKITTSQVLINSKENLIVKKIEH